MNGVATHVPHRPRLVLETFLILGVSLGASAIRSVLSIIERLTRPIPINEQTTTINASTTPDRPWLDLAYQIVNVALPLVVVALALYLLVNLRPPVDPLAGMGLDAHRPWKDLGWGAVLAAGIGLPGLVFYLFAVWAGFNLQVNPASITDNWWTIPIYLLLALKNGVLEEILMVGYLFARWAQAGWHTWVIVVVSAVIRGGYHLYQGFGGFLGNVVMGIVFGLVFLKTRRVWVLVAAHALIDAVVFVAYPLVAPYVSWI
jgi:membrane protease YdiL (CAAX protease family)